MATEQVEPECLANLGGVWVLMYSHNRFGLGHMRGTQTIANAVACDWLGSSIVILSGSPLIRSFKFRNGINFVCVPGVEKIYSSGVCTNCTLNMSIEEVVGLRWALILQMARTFNPDIFIIDHKLSGFRGEIVPALELLRARGCHIGFSVRDLLDVRSLFLPEYNRDGAIDSFEHYYDKIWVYGVEDFYRPFAELNLVAAAG